MDPYSVRSTFRYGGLALLLGAIVLFAAMQKSLLELRNDRATGGTRRTDDPNEAARLLLGERARVQNQGDIDGDGQPEIVATHPAAASPSGELWVSRVAVLSRRESGAFVTLFDSDQNDLSTSTWRVIRIGPRRVLLEAISADGMRTGRLLDERWDADKGKFVDASTVRAAASRALPRETPTER